MADLVISGWRPRAVFIDVLSDAFRLMRTSLPCGGPGVPNKLQVGLVSCMFLLCRPLAKR